ncbi:hypothetical protein IIA16_01620, partial [bacterium]|nr:hypothetical protein [bacterium]
EDGVAPGEDGVEAGPEPETDPAADPASELDAEPAADPAGAAEDEAAPPAMVMLPTVPAVPAGPEAGEGEAERPRPRPSPSFADLDEATLAAWLEPLSLLLTVAAAVPVAELRADRVVQPDLENAGWEVVWSDGGEVPRVTISGGATAAHSWPPTGLPKAPLLLLPFDGPGTFEGESGEGAFGLPLRLSWRQEGRLSLKWPSPIEASRTWELVILPPG